MVSALRNVCCAFLNFRVLFKTSVNYTFIVSFFDLLCLQGCNSNQNNQNCLDGHLEKVENREFGQRVTKTNETNEIQRVTKGILRLKTNFYSSE